MGVITKVRNRLGGLRQRVGRAWDRHVLRVPPRSANPYATHLPVLLAVGRLVPVRRVLELGCGRYSTFAFLDRRAFPDLATLHSLENDPTWGDTVRKEAGEDPRLTLTTLDRSVAVEVSAMDLSGYDLILIDDSTSAPERADTIVQVVSRCPKHCIVAIHDYEVFLYRHAGLGMPHRFRFTAFCPNTGLLWRDAALEMRRLQATNALIRRHTDSVTPDDISAWVTILSSASGD